MCMVIPKLAHTQLAVTNRNEWKLEKELPFPVTQPMNTKKKHIAWQAPLAIVLVYLLYSRL